MTSLLQVRFAQAQAWLVLMGIALQEQARIVSRGFQFKPQCSISRGPKLAYFDDGEALAVPHFLVDAKLEDGNASFGGTFLLPSIKPEASPEKYSVIIDESTGIYHVARQRMIAYDDLMNCPQDNPRQHTRHRHSNKKIGRQIDRVEIPDNFKPLTSIKYVNMPTFGLSEIASPSSSSVSITESNVGYFDSAIVAIGRPLGKFTHAATVGSTSVVTSTVNSKSENTNFFESLLKKKQIIQEVSPNAALLSSSTEPADYLHLESLSSENLIDKTGSSNSVSPTFKSRLADTIFFESLMAKENINGASFNKHLSVLTQDEHNLIDIFQQGHSDFASTLPSTLQRKDGLAISLPEINATEMSKYRGPLDLAMTLSTLKPRFLLSELDLDISVDQAHKILQETYLDEKPCDVATNLTAENPADNKPRYYRPIAPRQNAMSYEEYSLPHYGASSGSDQAFAIKVACERLSMNSSVTSTSEKHMFLLFNQEPLEESLWLDINKIFHNSEVAQSSCTKCDDELSLFSQSGTIAQRACTCIPTLKLPLNENRRAQQVSRTQDVSGLPVSPWSRNTMTAAEELQESSLRIRRPWSSLDYPFPKAGCPKTLSEESLRAAIETLDIPAIFGGTPGDWSDDAESDNNEPRLDPSYISPVHTATTNKDIEISERHVSNFRSENATSLDMSEKTSDAIASGINLPLKICYRLPISVIKAINLEKCRIWNFEGPWIVGVDEEKAYKLALQNVRRYLGDVPEDILFWIREVNSEFLRLVMEGQAGGSVWDLDTQREQIITLASSNVEWHHFGHLLKGSPKPESRQPTFEAAESSKNWILKMLGGEAQHCQLPSFIDTAAAAHKPTNCYRDPHEFFQVNKNENSIEENSKTSAVPFWSKFGPKLKLLFDVNNPHGQPGRQSVPSFSLRSFRASPLVHAISADDLRLEITNQGEIPMAAVSILTHKSEPDGPKDTNEISAPVIPALLLQLPNRVHEPQNTETSTSDIKVSNVVASIAKDESKILVHMEMKDVEPTISHQSINYDSDYENGVEISPTLAGTVPPSPGCTSRPDTTTEDTDFEDYDSLLTGNSSCASKLRPHRFFTVETPGTTASSIELFPAQRAMQVELDKVMEGLQYCCVKEEEEDEKVDPGDLVESLIVSIL